MLEILSDSQCFISALYLLSCMNKSPFMVLETVNWVNFGEYLVSFGQLDYIISIFMSVFWRKCTIVKLSRNKAYRIDVVIHEG